MRNNILVKSKSNPYYIVAPSYSSQSAGIKILHLLCHYLNVKGYSAFLVSVHHCGGSRRYAIESNLITPLLTDHIAEIHAKNGLKPIVVYPDVVDGNPLQSSCVVRYLMHYPGFLGGQKTFADDELIFSYTKKIANCVESDEAKKVLFVPICDDSIFYPPKPDSKRSGSCFYAAKYLSFHKGELLDITKNSLEIRRGKGAQTTAEVADILRKSEYFISYEDTSLITEAILCECPAVLVKNNHFDGRTLAEFELGLDGCAFSDKKEDIEQARKSIPQAKENFYAAVNNFWNQLEVFIDETQKHAQKSGEAKVVLDRMVLPSLNFESFKKNLKRYISYKFRKKKS